MQPIQPPTHTAAPQVAEASAAQEATDESVSPAVQAAIAFFVSVQERYRKEAIASSATPVASQMTHEQFVAMTNRSIPAAGARSINLWLTDICKFLDAKISAHILTPIHLVTCMAYVISRGKERENQALHTHLQAIACQTINQVKMGTGTSPQMHANKAVQCEKAAHSARAALFTMPIESPAPVASMGQAAHIKWEETQVLRLCLILTQTYCHHLADVHHQKAAGQSVRGSSLIKYSYSTTGATKTPTTPTTSSAVHEQTGAKPKGKLAKGISSVASRLRGLASKTKSTTVTQSSKTSSAQSSLSAQAASAAGVSGAGSSSSSATSFSPLVSTSAPSVSPQSTSLAPQSTQQEEKSEPLARAPSCLLTQSFKHSKSVMKPTSVATSVSTELTEIEQEEPSTTGENPSRPQSPETETKTELKEGEPFFGNPFVQR